MRRTSLRPSVPLLLLTLSASLPSRASGLTDAALGLLNERVTSNRGRFFVYLDSDSGFNHGVPSGFFGTLAKLHLDTACVYDAGVAQRCTADPTRLDPVRGTAINPGFGPCSHANAARQPRHVAQVGLTSEPTCTYALHELGQTRGYEAGRSSIRAPVARHTRG